MNFGYHKNVGPQRRCNAPAALVTTEHRGSLMTYVDSTTADQAMQFAARVRAAMVQFGPLPPDTYTKVETGIRDLSRSSGVAPEKLAELLEAVGANIDAKAN